MGRDWYGFLEAKGRLSSRGSHGHLGDYDRDYKVTWAELDVCRTVAHLAHCVMPNEAMQRCVTTGRTGYEVSSEIETRFGRVEMVRRGRGDGPDVYTLSIHAADSPAESVVELELPASGIPYDRTTLSLEELQAVTGRGAVLEADWQGEAGDEVEYGDLAGWIAHPPKNTERGLAVSISGTAPNIDPASEVPRRLHVWGVYPVERVVEAGGADERD
jgi:hypothetical protein